MLIILTDNFHFWRTKITILEHFIQSLPILDHFTPFWMGTLSKIMVNYKILTKALMGGQENILRVCCWDLKSGPIFIPNFAVKWDSFLYQSHKFWANFTNNFTLFFKNVKLSSKFRKFWYHIDEISPIVLPILEYFENMTHVYTSFCTE